MADLSVRPARPEDAERVARVQLSTWRTAWATLLPPAALEVPEVTAAALWLGAVERPPTPRHRLLVALEGDQLVGFAASGPDDDADSGAGDVGAAPTVELQTLLVEPRWGRRGHASRLLAACVEHWRADGATLARCWAFERDPATRSFLTGAGWELDGHARLLDAGAGEPARQLRLHTDLRAG